MARNGSGVYSLPAGNPVVTGTTISSTWANTTLSDIANGITTSIAYDGQTVPVANLPMGGFGHTNVANATVRTMYSSAGQVQDGALTYLGSVSGTDTITASAAVGMTSYTVGQNFRFISAGANTTTTVTININGIGAKNITKNGATALAIGDIPSGSIVTITYDGTQFQATGISQSLLGTNNTWTGTNTWNNTSTWTVDSAFTSTGAVQVPVGTTAQQPAGANGKIRYNSTTGKYEGYSGSTYNSFIDTSSFITMKNRIINGNFSVAQRGTTYALTNSVAYGSVDRWVAYQGVTANGVANQVASGLTGFQYALKLGRNNAAVTTGNINTYTILETVNSIPLAGQTVTLSFYAKAGANFSATSNLLTAQLYSGTGTDQSAASLGSWTGSSVFISATQAITTSWVRYTFTGSVSASATQIGLQFLYTPTGTAGADDNLYITGVQLEIGSTATSFENRPYGMELALCQRYYYRIQAGLAGQILGSSYNATTSTALVSTPFPVPLRTYPTAIEQDGTAGDYRVNNLGTSTVCTSVPTFNNASVNFAFTTFTTGATLTAGQASAGSATNTNAYLGWSAEL